jgi:hypothetical protein
MTDPDFEKELFGLYGEASDAWPDGGVTRRIMGDIAREDRLRGWALALAVAAGAVSTLAAAVAFAAPAIGQLAARTGAPAPVLWVMVPALAILMGWATVRLATDT